MLRYGSVLALACFWGGVANFQLFAGERELALAELSGEAKAFDAQVDASGRFTWWMPEGADAYVLPVAAGFGTVLECWWRLFLGRSMQSLW